MKCEENVWLPLHCAGAGRAQVMFPDKICATASHRARTRGLGWRTAHASSLDEKVFIYP